MKCRCGHGRQAHHPTPAGRRGHAQRVRDGRTDSRISQPCHQFARSTSAAFPPCACRDWHPQEAVR